MAQPQPKIVDIGPRIPSPHQSRAAFGGKPAIAATPGLWTAIILAGRRPGVDPLAQAFEQEYKALVPICGMPMLGHVVAALLEVRQIGRIVILAQAPEELFGGSLKWVLDSPKVQLAPSCDGISQSIANVAGTALAPWPLLITTADHPLLTTEMVESFLGQPGQADVSVAAVERKTLLARYPDSKRTWLHFRDGAYTGANLFALRSARTRSALELWARAEQDRKQALKMFWHFGPMLALRAITRTIGFSDALARAGDRLGLSAALVALDIAEAGIDVDKLSDHYLAEEIMLRRLRKHRGR